MTRPGSEERSNPGEALAPNPDVVNEFHRYSDVDNESASQHHTLGSDPNQASPGDHNHDGRNSRQVSATSHTHGFTMAALTASIDVASVPANSAVARPHTVTGVAPGDVLVYQSGLTAYGLLLGGMEVTAADQVTLYLDNVTATAIDQGPATFTFLRFRPV